MKKQKLKGTKIEDFKPYGKKSRVESLLCEDLVMGSGDTVTEDAELVAHYTGALCVDGTIFQSSYDASGPLTFTLDEVIQGWKEGLLGMKAGGTRRLHIPSDMAYGRRRAAANIPPHSDLVFDIELLEVKTT